jgi:hypothetical protein
MANWDWRTGMSLERSNPVLAERVGVSAPVDMTSVWGPCESIGKVLRAPVRSLQQKAAPQ